MLLPILVAGALLIQDSANSGVVAENFASFFLQNDHFSYGVLPFVFANIGFWVTVFVSNVYTLYCGTTNQIEYGTKSRSSSLKESLSVISMKTQLWGAIKTVLIFFGLNTMVVGKYFFQHFVTHPEMVFPDMQSFLNQITGMIVLFDFFLYWQHRGGHTLEIMWNSHKTHHLVKTPVAVSAPLTGTFDELTSASLIYLSALFVQPHPVSYAFAIACILSELTALHTGLDSAWFDFITLRFLPGRLDIRMHDHHHKYSGKMGGYNYGHFFWIWDYAFGTLHQSTMLSKKQVM